MSTLRRSHVPLYLQVEATLRERIRHLQPGDRVPSDRELAAEFGISFVTARQAISRLVAEGLVYREVGRGTFVASPRLEKDMTGLTSFSEDMRRRGLKPSSRVLESIVRPASAEIAEALKLPLGSLVAYIRRVRMADGIPMAVETVAFSAAAFPGLVDQDLATQSLYEVLEQHYGLRLVCARGVLGAAAPTAEEAQLLEIPRSTPVIFARRVAFNERNEPIEYGDTKYRSDRYYLPIELWRPSYPNQTRLTPQVAIPQPAEL